jgi:hypothetical protein
MVERDHHVVQADRERGNLELIGFGKRHTFETSPQFVTEHAGPTAVERRQRRCWSRLIASLTAWFVNSSLPIDSGLKHLQRIAAIGRRSDPFDGVCRDE